MRTCQNPNPWPSLGLNLAGEASRFQWTLKEQRQAFISIFYGNLLSQEIKAQRKAADGVKLSALWRESVWVSTSMNVTQCHVGVSKEQIKWCCGKSIITIVLFICYHTHTHTHRLTRTQICTHAHSVAFWDQFGGTVCVVRTSVRYARVRVCVRVCVRTGRISILCVWPCGCAAIIITLVNTHMSRYWSAHRWAMRDLRLRRAAWICLDFYWDHTLRSAQVQPKISSRARLLALRCLCGQQWMHIWL